MQYSEPIPPGFTIEQTSQHTMTIHHQRSGMAAMNIFLMVWLSFWTIGCIGLLYLFILQLNGQLPENSDPVPPIIVFGFWAADIIVSYLLIYSIFCEKTFHLNYTDITIQTKLLRWQWQKIIPKTSIQQFTQIQDGGRGRDSFPSWGLKLEGKTPTMLIFRQPYEKSYWLGQVLADWAKVPFIPDTRKRSRR
jgi:hypothetical protein